jgi:hypothetical protein
VDLVCINGFGLRVGMCLWDCVNGVYGLGFYKFVSGFVGLYLWFVLTRGNGFMGWDFIYL